MHSLSFPRPSPKFPNPSIYPCDPMRCLTYFHISQYIVLDHLTPSSPPLQLSPTPQPQKLKDHCLKVKFVSSNLRLVQSIFEHIHGHSPPTRHLYITPILSFLFADWDAIYRLLEF